MSAERILYTDGHDVTVTDSTLRVRKSLYRLDGISKHSFSIVRPNRLPGLFFICLGLIGLTAGVSGGVQNSNFAIQVASTVLGSEIVLITFSGLLMLIGIIFIIATKEKYGVHIVTENGEKDVLVSDRKEYVSMVVEALNKAFIGMLRRTGSDSMEFTKKMSVSHR
jgi:hypothetical protein